MALTGLRVGQVTDSIHRTIGITSLVTVFENRILEACGVVESDASLIKLIAPRKDRQKKENLGSWTYQRSEDILNVVYCVRRLVKRKMKLSAERIY